MLAISIQIALAMVTAAVGMSFWRLLRGPDVPNRILALDTLYVNTIAILVLLGIHLGSALFFEAALLIALMGFIGTVALCKYLLRGDIIEYGYAGIFFVFSNFNRRYFHIYRLLGVSQAQGFVHTPAWTDQSNHTRRRQPFNCFRNLFQHLWRTHQPS